MSDVLVIGIGGAGCSMASWLGKQLGCMSAGVNSDDRGLDQFSPNARLLIDTLCGRGGRVRNPERAQQAAERAGEAVVALMAGYPRIVLLAGLGGATGTGASPVLARLALAHGHRAFVGLTLPFRFETERRLIAESTAHDLAMTLPCFVHDLEIASMPQLQQEALTVHLDRAAGAMARAVHEWLDGKGNHGSRGDDALQGRADGPLFGCGAVPGAA